jgi:hypothetical protein
MTGIAIRRQELRPAGILAAMALVTAGLLAGFGLAQVAPSANSGAQGQVSGGALELYRAPGFSEYRVGERGDGGDAGPSQHSAPQVHVGDAGP